MEKKPEQILYKAIKTFLMMFSVFQFKPVGMRYNINFINSSIKYQMNEYEQNMYLNDVFDILALNYGEISYALTPQSQIQNLSPQGSSNLKKINQQKVLEVTAPGTTQQKSINDVINISRTKLTANWIQCPQLIKNKARVVFQGGKDDTMHLNINFKTIIVNYFKQLQQTNELSDIEVKKLADFAKRSPSLQSLAIFCGGKEEEDEIRQKCLNFLESSMFICRILESKCRMAAKIRMIKFAQKLRLNLSSSKGVIKWKAYKQL